jgi:hypothetical protein
MSQMLSSRTKKSGRSAYSGVAVTALQDENARLHEIQGGVDTMLNALNCGSGSVHG